MLELLFGLFFGIWAGQQLPLPSVQIAIQNWWNSSGVAPTETETKTDTSEVTEEDHENTPIFTGDMPRLPSV
jgi:hypothetical protein